MRALVLCLCCVVAACGPSSRNNDCTGDDCNSGSCNPGQTRDCYTADKMTKDVGPCHGGMQTCTGAGQWGDCLGQQLPVAEDCSNGVDDNCNGMTDENIDADGDGYTTCAGDCCDSTECGNPAEVNPGAFDVPGDLTDNDCNGHIDDAVLVCDQGLMSNSQMGIDYAHAIDICPTTTLTGAALMNDPQRHWGIIDAKIVKPDETGPADPMLYSIRPHFGSKLMPQGGLSMAMISSGHAAGKGDANPPYNDFVSYLGSSTSAFPSDFVAANGGKLPNAPGCPEPLGSDANDPVMLEFTVRVPTNAKSFSLKVNFYSAEFPEWTCSPYNDFFVVLLDSTYMGTPPNPTDKNLAFYSPMGSNMKFPVGVNLAYGNTGLFTQCVNGATGCSGTAGTISTCMSTDDLMGTGMDDPAPFECDNASLKGGATGWLATSGNVTPGEIMKLRIAIWDTSDHAYDSLAVIDGFQWSADPSTPGTVILRQH